MPVEVFQKKMIVGPSCHFTSTVRNFASRTLPNLNCNLHPSLRPLSVYWTTLLCSVLSIIRTPLFFCSLTTLTKVLAVIFVGSSIIVFLIKGKTYDKCCNLWRFLFTLNLQEVLQAVAGNYWGPLPVIHCKVLFWPVMSENTQVILSMLGDIQGHPSNAEDL